MLERTFISTLKSNPEIVGTQGIVLAVSGGKDSMVLLHLAKRFEHHLPKNVVVATLNHGIRRDALEDVKLVVQCAQNLEFPVIVGSLSPKSFCDENTLRNQRRAFLLDVMDQVKADRIWTAHHADDAVETMVLRLGRGAGLMGATSPKLYDDPWAKPLLTVFSEDIEEFRRRFGVPFREDSTNLLTDYERNKIRLELIPFWSELLGYDVRKTLFSSLTSMSVFREFVEEQGLCLLDQLTVERVPKMLKLRRKAFLSYSRSAQLVLFYLAVKSLKGDIRSRGHLEDAVNCVSKISDRDFGNFALKVNKEIFVVEVL